MIGQKSRDKFRELQNTTTAGRGKVYRSGCYTYRSEDGERWGKGDKARDKKVDFYEPKSQIEQEQWLDGLIAEINNLRMREYGDFIPKEVEYLLNLLIPILEKEPIILELEAPLVVAGDIHGQLHDLFRFFNQIGPPPLKKYLFQGDYVDRSPYDIEVIILLFAYKIRYPGYLNLLRGNHECKLINCIYGFKESCKRAFERDGIRIWKRFCHSF